MALKDKLVNAYDVQLLLLWVGVHRDPRPYSKTLMEDTF
jgi:hypothetical protein